MTTLRVNVSDLHEAGRQLNILAENLARGEPSGEPSGPAWLSSSASVSRAYVGANNARDALAGQMRATSHKIVTAAISYTNRDTHTSRTIDLAIGSL
ncbi:hypothetical protein [Mycobacterium sp. 48b]|uniref:hypothetical protein n=1 Tax=Mycobacterium sp. 48b TaxID=3400426 RepID=UPI003AABCC5B